MIAVVRERSPSVRSMCQADIPAVAAIERGTYSFPWSDGIFRDCLLAGYTNLVLDIDGDVVGYGIMSIAASEAHLLNICIAGYLRRRGIGRQLLEHMMQIAQAAAVECVYLEVRPSNRPALRMYEAAGFDAVGVRENYYKARDGKEDAMVLVRRFDESGGAPGDGTR